MRILISPAKKMNVDTDSLPYERLPQFLSEAKRLLRRLRQLDAAALQTLWGCGDAIAKKSLGLLEQMELTRNLTPAILSYEGIQYRYMAPGVLESDELAYIQEHLRILSGFYGLLRPFDGVAPYRLEMQAKLHVDHFRNLYDFWGGSLADQLCAESPLLLNLASREYSRAVSPHLPRGVRLCSCVFGELQNGTIVEKGVFCKMARGGMVRWLAENRITNPDDLKAFDRLGYAYSAEQSERDRLVFLKQPISKSTDL